jgi:hypothetical protein
MKVDQYYPKIYLKSIGLMKRFENKDRYNFLVGDKHIRRAGTFFQLKTVLQNRVPSTVDEKVFIGGNIIYIVYSICIL